MTDKLGQSVVASGVIIDSVKASRKQVKLKFDLHEVVTAIDGPFRPYTCRTENKGKAGKRLEDVSDTVAKQTVRTLKAVKVSSLI